MSGIYTVNPQTANSLMICGPGIEGFRVYDQVPEKAVASAVALCNMLNEAHAAGMREAMHTIKEAK